MKALFAMLAGTFLLGAVTQPDAAERKAFMDSVQDLRDGLEDSLPASPDQTVIAAGKLIEALNKERIFWEQARVPQGVQLATAAADRVSALKELAAKGDRVKAGDAFKRVSKSCSDCHDAHLEQILSSRH